MTVAKTWKPGRDVAELPPPEYVLRRYTALSHMNKLALVLPFGSIDWQAHELEGFGKK